MWIQSRLGAPQVITLEQKGDDLSSTLRVGDLIEEDGQSPLNGMSCCPPGTICSSVSGDKTGRTSSEPEGVSRLLERPVLVTGSLHESSFDVSVFEVSSIISFLR